MELGYKSLSKETFARYRSLQYGVNRGGTKITITFYKCVLMTCLWTKTDHVKLDSP